MKETFEITVDGAAMAGLGFPVGEADLGVDDLSPDPLADHYEALLGLHELEPVDGGSMGGSRPHRPTRPQQPLRRLSTDAA